MFTTFGQFIDHDIGVSPVGAFSTDAQPLFTASFLKFRDERPIEVPDNDPVFTEDLEFERAVYSRVDNEEVLPRRILNALTSFLDMSQVQFLCGELHIDVVAYDIQRNKCIL